MIRGNSGPSRPEPPDSLAETRRRGGVPGRTLQWFPRVSARASGFSQPKPRFSRRGAEARRNAKPPAFVVCPRLRAPVRDQGFFHTKRQMLSPRREGAKKIHQEGPPWRLCVLARVIVLCQPKPVSHGTVRPGEGRKNSYRVSSASPRLRENIRVFPTETTILSQRRGGAEECEAGRFCGLPTTPGPCERSGVFPHQKTDALAKTRRRKEDPSGRPSLAPLRLGESDRFVPAEARISRNGETRGRQEELL
jgi:hypothetical protein